MSISPTVFNVTNTLAALRDILNEETAAFWTDADLTAWLNMAQRDISVLAECIQNIDSLSTAGSNRRVTFTGHAVKYLEHATTGKALMRIEPRQEGNLPVASDGTPQYFHQSGQGVEIEPIPNAVYQLKAYIADKPATEMSAGGDYPEIPPVFHQALIFYAMAKAMLAARNMQAAVTFMTLCNSEMTYAASIFTPAEVDSHEVNKLT